MTTGAWLAAVLAGALAVADWVAVSPPVAWRRAELVVKPGAAVAILALAVALRPTSEVERWVFVAALACSLAGDVALMLPRDRFVAGLAAFLVAHLIYVAGFALEPLSARAALVAAGALAVAAVSVGRRILAAVHRRHGPALAGPVALYMAAISAMVAMAAATVEPLAVLGAALFFLSDSILAWNRFVGPVAWARPIVMATYHLGQMGLVLSLLR
jgi:uncharacterized membrane protein YhhN